MKAYRLLEWQQPARLVEVPVPDPGPGEVLVRIGGAGACHSDISVMEWPKGTLPFDVPFTLGHENAGWVEKLGRGATGFSESDPVAVYGPWGCGTCAACIRGLDNLCERWREPNRPRGGGLGRDGGMAEFMLVPSTRFLVPLRDLDPAAAAPLSDAGLTPYHAIATSLPYLAPGNTAVVIGVGGLGHLAVQILKAISAARVIAVDIAPERLELARRLGADATAVSRPEAAREVIEANGGRKPELVLDFVGNDATLALAGRLAKMRGRVVVVGIAAGSLDWGFGKVAQESEWMISSWGSLPELHDVIALAERGLLKPEVTTFPLARVEDAYQALHDGRLLGRAVVVP
jgi:propanol-preferring alcohol dehydrogenase